MEELEGLFEGGELILVGMGLAAITFIIEMAKQAREKGDKDPLASGFAYLIVGGIGAAILAAICTFILPVIGTIGGFIIGFALTLKVIYGKHISFWTVLLYPITFVIYTFVYFAGLAMFFGAMGDDNILGMAFGAFIFLATFYFGIYNYFAQPEEYKPPKRYKPEEIEKNFNVPKLRFIKKIKRSKPISKDSKGKIYSLDKEKKIILKITRNINTLENSRKSVFDALKPLKLLVTKDQIDAINWPHYDDKDMPPVAYYETEIVTSKGSIDILGFPRSEIYIVIKPRSFKNLKNKLLKKKTQNK